jgi:hypothetical protein
MRRSAGAALIDREERMTRKNAVSQAANEVAARIRRERQAWDEGADVVWLTPDGKPPRQMAVHIRERR